ncbi:MAG: histidine kinase, partial [Lachnospiraceae bacterium]|nr:histidine kinase [Lachnospiraceae bacterium]
REGATAVKLLGRSMRYVLENVGASVTSLEGETEHVDIYMMIQQLRFGDRILYEKKVEEGLELSEYQILPLLLQPVVENAILHGMEEKEEGGVIRLSVYSRISDGLRLLYIDVEDNGCGMTEEALEKLRKDIEIRDMSRSKSIGLYNINQRIRQYYGNGYRMHIYSKPQEGTLIRLIIPAEYMQ